MSKETTAMHKAEMRREFFGGLAWGGAILILALAAKYAQGHGYVGGDTVTRLVIGANGLLIAWFGNRMPKAFVPNACARDVRRVGGWALTLSGLVYAGLFAFAPLSVAFPAGSAAVLAGIAVTIGYCLALRNRARAA